MYIKQDSKHYEIVSFYTVLLIYINVYGLVCLIVTYLNGNMANTDQYH